MYENALSILVVWHNGAELVKSVCSCWKIACAQYEGIAVFSEGVKNIHEALFPHRDRWCRKLVTKCTGNELA